MLFAYHKCPNNPALDTVGADIHLFVDEFVPWYKLPLSFFYAQAVLLSLTILMRMRVILLSLTRIKH